MINLINYALLAEQKKYGYFNKINEAYDPAKNQTAENLKLVLSGATDDAYINQWIQLVKAIERFRKTSNTVDADAERIMIKDNNGNNMVLLVFTLRGGKLKISDVEVATVDDAKYFIGDTSSTNKKEATSTGPVTQAIKDAAQKIWVALEGSGYIENEGAVYAVFRDNIKTDADLQSLLSYWKSLKLPSFAVSGTIQMDRTSLEKTAKYHKNNKEETDPTGGSYSLEAWLNKFFDSNEIEQVNDKLSVNKITYRFKAL